MGRRKGSKNKPKTKIFVDLPKPVSGVDTRDLSEDYVSPVVKKLKIAKEKILLSEKSPILGKDCRPPSTEDLCYIIRVASKNNVSSLKIGDLSLSFGSQGHRDQPKVRSVDSVKPIAAESRASEVSTLTEEDERQLRDEARMGQLMIDDPVAYEQEILDRQGAGHYDRRQTQEAARPQSAL